MRNIAAGTVILRNITLKNFVMNNTLSSGGEGNKNTPAAEVKITPTAKATLFSAELEAKAILS